MRYLRLLSNSAFGGLLVAVYLLVLILHLNPDLPLSRAAVAPLLLTLLLSYGLHGAALLYVASAVRQMVVGPPPAGWISLRFLTWSATLLAGLASAVAAVNAAGFEWALELSAHDGLVRTSVAFGVAAGIFLVLAILNARVPRVARTVIAVVFGTVLTLSLALPLAWRLPSSERPVPRAAVPAEPAAVSATTPRVTLLLLDGGSLDVIAPAVAQGRLPNFGRLLDRGASMHLSTVRPTQPEPVWASVMTGKWPPKHQVRSAAHYLPLTGTVPFSLLPDYCFAQALVRFGLLRQEAQQASAYRAWTLWQILTSRGLAAGIIGLPMTQPAMALEGFMVSDRFSRSDEPAMALDERPAVYPPSLAAAARASLRRAQGAATTAPPSPIPPGGAGRLAPVADRVYQDLVARLPEAREVRLLAVRYPGLDAVGHYSLGYARRTALDTASEADRRRFGQTLDDYYAYVDELVGEGMASLRQGDLLLVVSGFGLEPLSLTEQLVERVFGDPRFSGTHARGPDGFLFAYGTMVNPGRVARGAIVDVVPTVLYFLGLPVARDMDGSPRTDVFARPFNAQRTITFLPSYEH